MCSVLGLAYLGVGPSPYHSGVGAEYHTVELVCCGLFGRTGTACTGSRACRERETFVAGQSWQPGMIRPAQQFFFLGRGVVGCVCRHSAPELHIRHGSAVHNYLRSGT